MPKCLRNDKRLVVATCSCRWTGVTDGPVAELCFCRSSRCRGVIADPSSKFMENTIHHYEKELDRLQNFHDDEQKSLLDRIESMDAETKKILSVHQQLSLIRRLDKNDKLQVTCDNIEVAVKRATDAMSVARHAKCMERATQYARKLQDLDCNHRKPKKPQASPPKPVFSTSGTARVSCCGWFGQEFDEPNQPLPLSLSLACGGSLRYVSTKPPWVPSGSRSRGTLNLKTFPPLSLPCSQLPSPRPVRPRHPRPKPLGKLPADITEWPAAGLMSLDERKKLMAWIEGRISARDNSRGVYPPDGAVIFAFWLHTRIRKPDEKKMRSFRTRWSGISTQDLLDRFEEESGESGGMSRRVVHCILADVLTYTPWKWDLQSEVKLVEDRGEGDRWPLLWMDLLTLPGIVPEFSADRVCSSHRS